MTTSGHVAWAAVAALLWVPALGGRREPSPASTFGSGPCEEVPTAVLGAGELFESGRYWHGSRLIAVPPGTRPLPAESVLAPALAAEGLRQFARVDELLRRARGGDSLPDFVALAARADERAERWRDAERRYRQLITLPQATDGTRAAAAARLAVVLEQGGRRDSAVAAWRRAALALPDVADWFALRRAELEVDTTVAYAIISGSRSPAAVLRARLFVARRRLAANDLLGALDVYRRYGRPLDVARVEFALGRRLEARARADTVLFRETTRADGILAATFLTQRFAVLTGAEWLAISRAYRAQRDLVAAERFARRAIRRPDTSVAAWLELVEIESAKRNLAGAQRAVDSAGARAGRAGATLIARARVGALAAADRWPNAEALVHQLVRAHPGDSNIARLVLVMAERHRLRGEVDAERARYLTLLRGFGDTPAVAAAYFRLGLLLYADGDGDSAAALVAAATRLDTARELGAGPRYWDARLRFERGDTAAVTGLRALAEEGPTSFYGTRARELVGDSVLVSRRPLPLPRAGSFPAARARQRIRLLASIGFDTEARAEAMGWAADTSASLQVLIAAAGAAAAAGYARESIALGEAARAKVGLTVGVARALFPYSYRSVIEAEAAEHCVDPLLLAAIIRQESRFDPSAVSRVGARGMSQVMPATGAEMFQRLRLGPWDQDLLFVPDFNLHLGARYLRERIARDSFPTHALLASYNAGPTRVTRWRRWLEFEDPDLFVERVSITETRDYVRTVYASYRWYKEAYAPPPGVPPAAPPSPLP